MRAAAPSTHSAGDRRPGGSGLLVIDMISSWDFPQAAGLAAQALAIVAPLARLIARCRGAGVPVIYANDNRGRWRSDLRRQVQQSIAAGPPGAEITQALQPQDEDYVVLKPKHSAFYCTPMELLLRDLQLERLILTGVASDQCVLATASDARMRQCAVVVPRDCVASHTAERTEASLRHFSGVMQLPTPLSRRLRLA